MESARETGKPPARSLPEALARTLRHEVGDLLQTLYASVAILQKRLPSDWTLERRVLSDMRSRAESCKNYLDKVHDYVCPPALSYETVDLAELAAALVRASAARYPQLQLEAQSTAVPSIQADGRRLGQVGEILLANACEAAKHHVWFGTDKGPAPGQVQWTVSDDGSGVAAEHRERLFTPFFTTRHGHPGLGLALAHKIVGLLGGTISAENLPHEGFRVRVVLPAEAQGQDHNRRQTRDEGYRGSQESID